MHQDERLYKKVARTEQPDFLLESENIDEQGGVVQNRGKSDHKALKRKGGNWGKPNTWEQIYSHRRNRRKKIDG